MGGRTYAVIMAGGSGTRFWPASRRSRPKQLLPLAGEEPLLAQAVARVLPATGLERLRIATGAHLVASTLAAVRGLRPENLLVEPVPRNTAPCLGWAAAHVAREDPEAVVMALPSDPHIADEAAFAATLERAVARAREGVITTIGITPTHPETGYGYIQAAPGEGLVRDVARFVEKPDRATAEQFLADGSFYWNAGMFFFRAKDMLAAIAAHLPALAEGLAELDRAAEAGDEARALAELFPRLPAVSIDVGVMEKVSPMSMVVGDFGWSDLGSWPAVAALAQRDEAGNSAPSNAVLVASRDCHVVDARSAGDKPRVIALVGVEGLVVVETDDALLVMRAEDAQDVRRVVDELRSRGDDHLT
ncbi:MAG: NTP transferase domain-containing protein [Myxococcales bacterium]|nr:NTP transferase domain-containing protein [Myxococcales bacterium]